MRGMKFSLKLFFLGKILEKNTVWMFESLCCKHNLFIKKSALRGVPYVYEPSVKLYRFFKSLFNIGMSIIHT